MCCRLTGESAAAPGWWRCKCRPNRKAAPIKMGSRMTTRMTPATMISFRHQTEWRGCQSPTGTADSTTTDYRRSLPHLSITVDNIFVAAELLQPTRAAGVELVGADADLRAQAELEAVVEASAGVDHDCRRIDRRREAPGDAQ